MDIRLRTAVMACDLLTVVRILRTGVHLRLRLLLLALEVLLPRLRLRNPTLRTNTSRVIKSGAEVAAPASIS